MAGDPENEVIVLLRSSWKRYRQILFPVCVHAFELSEQPVHVGLGGRAFAEDYFLIFNEHHPYVPDVIHLFAGERVLLPRFDRV